MNDWAMPRLLWKKTQDKKDQTKQMQTNLDGAIEKRVGPRQFTCKGALDAIAKHIVCNDQALALADDVTFRNCLVSMRPRATKADIPSTHDIMQYIHNEFVALLRCFKTDISVCPHLPAPARYSHLVQFAAGKISCTIDGWSVDTTKASFLGLTGHWIEVKDGQWMLRSEVLAFRGVSGQHTSENLGRYFVALAERVGLINSETSKVHQDHPLTNNILIINGAALFYHGRQYCK
jgi:hypothetical protein